MGTNDVSLFSSKWITVRNHFVWFLLFTTNKQRDEQLKEKHENQDNSHQPRNNLQQGKKEKKIKLLTIKYSTVARPGVCLYIILWDLYTYKYTSMISIWLPYKMSVSGRLSSEHLKNNNPYWHKNKGDKSCSWPSTISFVQSLCTACQAIAKWQYNTEQTTQKSTHCN